MRYPNCYSYWIEYEASPGAWTAIDMKAGHSTLAAAAARLVELGGAGEPWSSRTYRIVDREGRPLEVAAA